MATSSKVAIGLAPKQNKHSRQKGEKTKAIMFRCQVFRNLNLENDTVLGVNREIGFLHEFLQIWAMDINNLLETAEADMKSDSDLRCSPLGIVTISRFHKSNGKYLTILVFESVLFG